MFSGAGMLQSLLEHHADLETSMANQQERCKRLQSRVGDIEAKLSTEIEQLRREEVSFGGCTQHMYWKGGTSSILPSRVGSCV